MEEKYVYGVGILEGKICVWDSISGGAQETGLLPLIFFSPPPLSENYPDVAGARLSGWMCPERNHTYTRTRTSISDFPTWGTRQGANMALNEILRGFICVFSVSFLMSGYMYWMWRFGALCFIPVFVFASNIRVC